MNNSISFRRTVLYARKHYVENARYYGYGLLAILILLSVFAWFYGSWRSDPGEFRVTACFTMLGFMYYVTRLSCRNLYKRLPMVRSYTLPVTAAEKYLFIWFNTPPCFSASSCGLSQPRQTSPTATSSES